MRSCTVAPDQLVGAEAQQRAQRVVHAHDAALGRDQGHGRRRDVEGAVEAGEGGLATGVDAAAGHERVEADLELVGAERLDHAVVRARQQQTGHVVGRRRERQQRHLAEAPAQGGDRARAGGRVEHDGVGAAIGDQAGGLQRVERVHDVVAQADELADVGPELGVAGDDEDARAIGARIAGHDRRVAAPVGVELGAQALDRRALALSHVDGRQAPRALAVGSAVDVHGQVDHEERAALGRVGERDGAVVQRHEVAHDREPQPGASRARRAGRAPAVALEDRLAQPVLHARAAVGDLDAHPLAGARDGAAHGPARRRVLQRVGEQVGDDREHLLLVQARRQLGRRLEHEGLVAQLGDAGEALAARANEPGDVDVARFELEVAAVQARDLQQLLDALEQHVGVGADAPDVLGLAVAELGRGEQPPAQPEHDGQRRLELVAHPGQQLTALIIERTRPTRERAGLEIAAVHVIDASPHRPSLRSGIAPVGIRSDHSLKPPRVCTTCVPAVRPESKRAVPPTGGEVRTPASAASSPRGGVCNSPVCVQEAGLGSLGHGPKRHDALLIVRLSHQAAGGGRADRLIAALRPPGGSPTPPTGAARAAVG